MLARNLAIWTDALALIYLLIPFFRNQRVANSDLLFGVIALVASTVLLYMTTTD